MCVSFRKRNEWLWVNQQKNVQFSLHLYGFMLFKYVWGKMYLKQYAFLLFTWSDLKSEMKIMIEKRTYTTTNWYIEWGKQTPIGKLEKKIQRHTVWFVNAQIHSSHKIYTLKVSMPLSLENEKKKNQSQIFRFI